MNILSLKSTCEWWSLNLTQAVAHQAISHVLKQKKALGARPGEYFGWGIK